MDTSHFNPIWENINAEPKRVNIALKIIRRVNNALKRIRLGLGLGWVRGRVTVLSH